jgi:7,8-dihydro-6-hydroxymethylpterin-pyrophosphokinase
LSPLNEIAPQMIHPVLKKTIKTLLSETKDPLKVVKVEF